jgi:hypothetical protein
MVQQCHRNARNAPLMPQNAKCQKEKKQLILPNINKKISPINLYILISKTKTRKKAVSLFSSCSSCWPAGQKAKQNTHRQIYTTGYIYKIKNVIAYGHIHHIYINILLLVVNIDMYCTYIQHTGRHYNNTKQTTCLWHFNGMKINIAIY